MMGGKPCKPVCRGENGRISKNAVSCETAFESGLRAGGEENGRGFDQRNHPAAVDQFHLFLTFIGDDGDDLEARVGFDVYRRVDRPFSDAGDAPGKLIARGELQAAILGGGVTHGALISAMASLPAARPSASLLLWVTIATSFAPPARSILLHR